MVRPAFIDQLSLPVVAAPMFLISGPDLVIECCKNGIVGSFPSLNQRSSEEFEQWLIEIRQRLKEHEQLNGCVPAPFAVNLIVHASNTRLEEDLALCIKHRVPLVITSLGIKPQVIDAMHSYGGLVYHDIIKRRHAEKAAEAGVDGLILVSAGAGGHGGTINPFSLVAEIREVFSKTILLSGCISNGRDIATALQMGADMAYMGTRFINTRESMASGAYQNMIIEAGASDIIYTAAVSGINANFLRASLEATGLSLDTWEKNSKVDFDAETGAGTPWKSIWSAGQGVGSISDVKPVAKLLERLKMEFKQAILEQSRRLDIYPK